MLALLGPETPFHVVALLEWLDNFLRYLLVAAPVFFVFWVWGSERFRRRILARRTPPTAPQLRREIGWSFSTAAIFAAAGVALFYGRHAGIFQVYLDVDERGWGYLALSSIALIVLQDTYFYWTHRAMHHPRLFKLVHRVHHLSTSPSPWAAYAFGPIEAAVHAVFVLLVTPWMPVHPLALLTWLVFMIVRNVFGHLGIELLPRWLTPLVRWSTTTTHHDLHHRRPKTNFGLYFTFWDRLAGTTDPHYEAELLEVTTRGPAPSPPEGLSLSSRSS